MTGGLANGYLDASLLTLGITQTFYETAMYLFVFLWVPALEIVSHQEGNLPFGIIFSAFMCCMSFGSLVYGVSSDSAKDGLVKRHASLAVLTCGAAALALVTSAMSMSLSVRFWAFCAFEATVGMYFPIMGTLRGTLIPDEARASVSPADSAPWRPVADRHTVLRALQGSFEHSCHLLSAHGRGRA